MTFSILLSLILTLGSAGGPTGDFDTTAESESVATSTATTDTVKRSKGN